MSATKKKNIENLFENLFINKSHLSPYKKRHFFFRVNALIIEQTLLSNSVGGSLCASLTKSIRNNLDFFCSFSNNEREWRNFISSIASGQEFSILKSVLLTSSLQKYEGLDLSDFRSSYPYAMVILNRGNRHLRFR